MIKAAQAATFLTDAEILKLTGVSHKDKDRHRLMIAELVRLGIPHYVNRASKIIVVRAVIEGGRATVAQSWTPTLARA